MLMPVQPMEIAILEIVILIGIHQQSIVMQLRLVVSIIPQNTLPDMNCVVEIVGTKTARLRRVYGEHSKIVQEHSLNHVAQVVDGEYAGRDLCIRSYGRL